MSAGRHRGSCGPWARPSQGLTALGVAVPTVFVWLGRQAFEVTKCESCWRDVWIRWPERWGHCEWCGKVAIAPATATAS
jgi:hypothetical protein